MYFLCTQPIPLSERWRFKLSSWLEANISSYATNSSKLKVSKISINEPKARSEFLGMQFNVMFCKKGSNKICV